MANHQNVCVYVCARACACACAKCYSIKMASHWLKLPMVAMRLGSPPAKGRTPNSPSLIVAYFCLYILICDFANIKIHPPAPPLRHAPANRGGLHTVSRSGGLAPQTDHTIPLNPSAFFFRFLVCRRCARLFALRSFAEARVLWAGWGQGALATHVLLTYDRSYLPNLP